jgi:muramoyltetrapeptide carboxypeptidase
VSRHAAGFNHSRRYDQPYAFSTLELQTDRMTAYSGAVLYPPPVLPGDTLRIVAPSGPFDKTLFYRALAWLGQRYRVIWSRGILERRGYLAGSDQRRLDELNEALRDPHARALIAVRGGYGATRIAAGADFASLARHPKWCVGFSDFTALHLEALRAGVASLHAQNLGALGRADEVARAAWLEALERPLACRTFSGLAVLSPGRATGTLVGGNLTMLFTAAASGQLALPRGVILFFEEVNEAPYRIDRMLTALCASGHLDAVAGFCVGDLAGDGQHGARREACRAVLDCLGHLGVPILAGLPVGHGLVNLPLPLGLPARLDAALGALIVNPEDQAPAFGLQASGV